MTKGFPKKLIVHSMQAVLLLFFTGPGSISMALAQGNTPPADSVDFSPGILDVSEMADFISQSRALIRQINELKAQQTDLAPVEEEILETDTLLRYKIALLGDSTSLWRLDQLEKEEQEIALIDNRIEAYRSKLQELSSISQNLDLELNFRMSTWQLTLDSLRREAAASPPADANERELEERLRNNITEVMADLRTAQSSLRSFRNFLQNLQSELNVTQENLQESAAIIQERTDEVVQQIWLPDRPPIWKLYQDTLAPIEGITLLESVFGVNENILTGYWRNYPNLPVFLLVAFLLILLLVYYLRSRQRSLIRKFPEELGPAVTLLKFPIFSSLIIIWFLLELFFEPPREVSRSLAALMLIPVCFLYWRLDTDRKWWQVALLVFFYLLFLFLIPLRPFPVVHRLTLLTAGLASFITVYLFLRDGEDMRKNNDTWLNLLPVIVRIFLFISAISVLANIIGSVQLAQLFSYATLGTFLAYIILTEAVVLSRSLLFMLALGPLHDRSFILQEDSDTVLRWTRRILSILAVGLWFVLTLDMLSIREFVSDLFFNWMSASLTIGNFSLSLGAVISFFLILQIASWASRLVRYLLDKEVFPRVRLGEGVPNTISLMIRFTFSVLGLIFAVAALGIELEKVAIAVGALGVGIGFGLQKVVNNFLSGILLALERPIKIGDIIELPEVSGRVTDIGLRASTIRAWDGSDVVVPNGNLLDNPLVNWTKSDKRRRVQVDVRVPFDSDPEEVGKILVKTAGSHPYVLKRPGPYLNFEGIGTSALEIKLYFWISDAGEIFTLGTEVRTMVYRALREAGYEIPVPRQDIQLSTGDQSTESTSGPKVPGNGAKEESAAKREKDSTP